MHHFNLMKIFLAAVILPTHFTDRGGYRIAQTEFLVVHDAGVLAGIFLWEDFKQAIKTETKGTTKNDILGFALPTSLQNLT